MEVSSLEAERLRRSTAAALLAARRLLLVLDLDHTLLNSAQYSELSQEEGSALEAWCAEQGAQAPGPLHAFPDLRLWTKLRPGVGRFLADAARLFDLAVYTMGDRCYAEAMAALLDPDARLFQGRVISATDSTARSVKDLDVVLGNDRSVLILDDTAAVWPRHRANLMVVPRYVFFPSCARKFQTG